MAPPTATMTMSGTESTESKDIAIKLASVAEKTDDEDKHAVATNGKMGGPPTFDDKYKEREYLKGRLAMAFRIFAKHGFEEGVAGHITLRDPVETDTFWVNPFGVPFGHITASQLIRVDGKGTIIDHGSTKLLNKAAYLIHHAVHTARPDVMCAAHSHSIYGRAFSTLGRPLDITTQDSCAFYNDLAVYEQFNGIVLDEHEGIEIAKSLGQKKAAILMNHGLLTTGSTIEEAVFWFMSLEKCCHVQLMADAAAAGRGGATVKVNDEDAAYTYKSVGTKMAGWFSALPEFAKIERETNGEYKA